MERQLDRPEIIRDIVMGRIPYMADDFYTKEGKKRVKDPVFRMKFKDLLGMITLRAGTLKAQGLHSASTGSTQERNPIKIAAATTGRFQGRPQEQGRPRPQTDKIPAGKCCFCTRDHQPELCPKFLDMGVHQRAAQLRRMGCCYRCLEQGHISSKCPRPAPKCGECGEDHITALHIPRVQTTRAASQNQTRRQNAQQPISTSSTTGEAGGSASRA